MRPVLIAFLLAPTVALAAPVLLQHQGRLLGPDDKPVTGAVHLTFAIHKQAAADGNGADPTWWVGTEATVQARDGLYAVLLGHPLSGTGELPDSVFDGEGERWLAVSVEGQAVLPRLRVAPVPFAVLATRATEAKHAESATRADAADSLSSGCDACVGRVHLADAAVGAAQLDTSAGKFAGLDADLLDGHDSAYFVDASNLVGRVGPAVSWDGAAIDDVHVASASAWNAKLAAVAVKSPLTGDGKSEASAIGLAKADASTDGYLGRADFQAFSAFASKLDSVAVKAPITGDGRTATTGLSIAKADETTDGYLAKADFAAFKAKADASNPAVLSGVLAASSRLAWPSPVDLTVPTTIAFEWTNADGGFVLRVNEKGGKYYTVSHESDSEFTIRYADGTNVIVLANTACPAPTANRWYHGHFTALNGRLVWDLDSGRCHVVADVRSDFPLATDGGVSFTTGTGLVNNLYVGPRRGPACTGFLLDGACVTAWGDSKTFPDAAKACLATGDRLCPISEAWTGMRARAGSSSGPYSVTQEPLWTDSNEGDNNQEVGGLYWKSTVSNDDWPSSTSSSYWCCQK